MLARLKQLNLDLGTRRLMGPLQGIRLTRLPLLTTVWRDDSQLTVVTLGNGKVLVRGVRNRCFTGRRDLNRISTARSYRRRYLPRMFTIILGTCGYPLILLTRLKQLNLDIVTRSLMGPLQGIRLARLPLLAAVRRGNTYGRCVRL